MFLGFAPARPSLCGGMGRGRLKGAGQKSKQVPTVLCRVSGPWYLRWGVGGARGSGALERRGKEQGQSCFPRNPGSPACLSYQPATGAGGAGGGAPVSPGPPSPGALPGPPPTLHRGGGAAASGRRGRGQAAGRRGALTSDRPPRSSVSCPLSTFFSLSMAGPVHPGSSPRPAACCSG